MKYAFPRSVELRKLNSSAKGQSCANIRVIPGRPYDQKLFDLAIDLRLPAYRVADDGKFRARIHCRGLKARIFAADTAAHIVNATKATLRIPGEAGVVSTPIHSSQITIRPDAGHISRAKAPPASETTLGLFAAITRTNVQMNAKKVIAAARFPVPCAGNKYRATMGPPIPRTTAARMICSATFGFGLDKNHRVDSNRKPVGHCVPKVRRNFAREPETIRFSDRL